MNRPYSFVQRTSPYLLRGMFYLIFWHNLIGKLNLIVNFTFSKPRPGGLKPGICFRDWTAINPLVADVVFLRE